MARLPTRDDLGYGASGRSGRPIARYDITGGINAVGNSLNRFGNTVAGAGVQVAEAMLQEQSLTDSLTADGKAMRDLNDLERSFDKRSDYQAFGDSWDESAKQIVETYAGQIENKRARQALESTLAKRVESGRQRVLNLRDKGVTETQRVELKQSVEGYQSIIADTSASEEDRQQAKDFASAAIGVGMHSGLLSPAEAEQWRDTLIDGGEFVFAQRMVEQDPDSISGTLPAAVADRSSIAMDFFQGRGYTKEQAAGIVGNLIAESKLQPSGAVGDNGTAYGIAQWRGDRLTRLKRYAAANQKNWQDLQTQLEFIDIELQDSETSAYKKLKNAETIEEATAAFVGYERPAGWSEGNPAGAHNFDGRLRFAGQAAGETIRPDWYTSQSPDKQLRLEKQADSRRKEIANDIKSDLISNIAISMQNAPDSIAATGSYNGFMPSEADFLTAYGAIAGQQKYQAFQTEVATAGQVHEMRNMPENEIRQVLQNLPTPEGDNAAAMAGANKAITGAASQIFQARESDGAGYVIRTNKSVGAAWGSLQSPGDFANAITATIAAQQELGIRNIQPLPNEQAASAVEKFKDTELPEKDRFGAIASVIMATDDPAHRKMLFDQLVDAGLPAISEGAFEALSRGDEGAGRRLLQAAMINPADLPGKIDSTQADIDEEIQSELMDEGGVGDAYYGLSDGTAPNLERASRDSKLISNAVHLRMRQGESRKDAVKSVGKDLYGDVQVVETSRGINARILVEKGANTDAILDGLRNLRPTVTEIIKDSMALPGDVPVADGTKAIMDATSANYAERVLDEGYFRNVEGGYVFIDPFVGAALSDVDGNSIVFTDEDVATSHGEAEGNREATRAEILERRVEDMMTSPEARGIGMQAPAIMQSVIDAVDKEVAPTLNDIPLDTEREREERAFREGRKAFEQTQGTPADKKKAQADTVERILNGE